MVRSNQFSIFAAVLEFNSIYTFCFKEITEKMNERNIYGNDHIFVN